MDALSEILHSVKLEGAVFYNAKFTAPWGFRSPPSCEVAGFLGQGAKHVIIYRFLTQGRARGEVEGSTHCVELVPGDIVVFPHGELTHHFQWVSGPHRRDNGKQLKEVFSQGMVPTRSGGGGESTVFVCGYMECDRELCKHFLGGLPPVFKVNIRNDRAGQWLENSIKFSAAEASTNRVGSDAVLARLFEALFVETLRRYLAELPPQQTGWLAGARAGGGSGIGAETSRSGIRLDDCESRAGSGSVPIRVGRAVPALLGCALARNWLIGPGCESGTQDQTSLPRSSMLDTRCEQGVAN
jgi:hypothetical protein